MAKKNLKVGDLVYLKNVGFPYNRTDDGGESFEGASGIVTSLDAGPYKMINVQFLFPILTMTSGTYMKDAVFHFNQVIKENRPWLKKHIKQIFKFKKNLIELGEKIIDELA